MGLTKELIIKDICDLYKIGLTNTEIADELGMSLETIKSYMKRYIRTDKDYKYIKELHDIRKKRMQELKRMDRYIEKTAIREIENRVRKCISTEQLIKRCESAYRSTKNGTLYYKYDENTRPIDLPKKYVPVVR